jgi:hypothetical protein
MDTKNLPRARMTIDIVWAHFWCDPARFSSVVVLRRGGGHGGSGEAEEKPFRSTNTEIPITCCARVASQPAGSIAFTYYIVLSDCDIPQTRMLTNLVEFPLEAFVDYDSDHDSDANPYEALVPTQHYGLDTRTSRHANGVIEWSSGLPEPFSGCGCPPLTGT